MLIRFIGDVHGRYTAYNEWIKCEHPTIQVGDFGLGFEEPPIMNKKDRFIRGNHDNPALCFQHSNYIADGTIENNIMFIGGAESVDKQRRVEGVSWWRDEELSYNKLNDCIDKAAIYRPSIMVTHEAPVSIRDTMHFDLTSGRLKNSRSANAFDTILKLIKPKLWVFGHYHQHINRVIDGTQFICCDINQAVDIELGEVK